MSRVSIAALDAARKRLGVVPTMDRLIAPIDFPVVRAAEAA